MADPIDFGLARQGRLRSFTSQLLAGSRPIPDTLAGNLLQSLGIARVLVEGAGDLFFHPSAALDLKDRERAPAMIGVVRDSRGDVAGLHLTLLQPTGVAVGGEKGVRLFGDVGAGAVRLWPRPTRGRLVVSEGIENTLAAADLADELGWALVAPEAVGRVELPPGIDWLAIASGGTPEAGARAEQLALRMASQCRRIEVVLPPEPGLEWTQVIRTMRSDAA